MSAVFLAACLGASEEQSNSRRRDVAVGNAAHAADDDEEHRQNDEAAPVQGAATELGHEEPTRDGASCADRVLADRKRETRRYGDAGLLQEECRLLREAKRGSAGGAQTGQRRIAIRT